MKLMPFSVNKKKSGSYYTPKLLANFITKRILSFKNEYKDILEPSVGDGIFVQCFFDNLHHSTNDFSITVFEKNKNELKKTTDIYKQNKRANVTFKPLAGDFLDLYKEIDNKFDIIIGNPPYIKKNRLTKKQIEESKKILKENGLKNGVNNIWVSFLISCIKLLKDDGIISLVLPSELLQVKFAEEIREFLKKTFRRIEIFTFYELLFDGIGQDTVVFIGYKKSDSDGIFYSNIDRIEDIKINNPALEKNDLLNENNYKWTHHSLDQGEIKLISKLSKKLLTASHYCSSKPGIVTAANDYFIVDDEIVKKYKLERIVKPIVQRGMFVNGKVDFTLKDFSFLKEEGIPSNLICFYNKSIVKHLKEQQTYIRKAYLTKIHKRYKMTVREKWYIIPNLVKPSDAFFFKRSHLYPKLIKNTANIYITDAAYSVEMKKDYNINSFIYSFYNSLTLIFAELYGRYYGGGVLEVTPSEFKKLPVPYLPINNEKFNNFKSEFVNKISIQDILDRNDKEILKTHFGVTNSELFTLKTIRNKLLLKRLNKPTAPSSSIHTP